MFRRKKSERLELSERIKEVTEKNAEVLAQLQQAKLNLQRAQTKYSNQKYSFTSQPEPLVRPELELKFQTEPIVGWRVWNTTPYVVHGGVTERRLGSVGVHGNWNGYHRVEARCIYCHHDAPSPGCHCGLWALKNEDDVLVAAHQYSAQAYGEVYLWGHVLECQRGWRAQYAYPKTIYTHIKDYVEPLKETYGVPVEYREWLRLVQPSPPANLTTLISYTPPSGGYVQPAPIGGHYYTTASSSYVPTTSGVQSWVRYGVGSGGGSQLMGGSEDTG